MPDDDSMNLHESFPKDTIAILVQLSELGQYRAAEIDLSRCGIDQADFQRGQER